MWGVCMPIFKSLAPLVREENEVTGGRMDTGQHAIFGGIHIQKF